MVSEVIFFLESFDFYEYRLISMFYKDFWPKHTSLKITSTEVINGRQKLEQDLYIKKTVRLIVVHCTVEYLINI